MDSIRNNFHSTTKNIYNKGNQYELEICKNDENLIDDFYKTMQETANRNNVTFYSKEYFKSFYKELHKDNHSDIYVIYLNKKKTLALLNDNLKEVKTNQENTNKEGKKKELQNQIDRLEKLINEIAEVKEDKMPLSSMVTAKYGDKVWTVHGGNSNLLRNLNSNYLLYFEIIKDAVEEGYKTADFFGTSFNPSKDDPEYGIWLFKKRLGGEYTEFMGEFDLITNKFMYSVFNTIIPIYRNIVKGKRKKELKDEIRDNN
jgi:peptidoglycan pentaglycine glycine transferase (the first glycine)